MREDIGVHKGVHQLYNPAVLQPRRQSGGLLLDAIKGHNKPMFICLPNSSHDVPPTTRDTTTVSKMGPIIVVWLLSLMVLRQNPSIGTAPPTANRARDKAIHKGWPVTGTIQGPIMGIWHPSALYLSPGQEVSFTPLRVGWHLAIQVLPVPLDPCDIVIFVHIVLLCRVF
jgi:hypothetical protein